MFTAQCAVRRYILKPRWIDRRGERIVTRPRQSTRKSGGPGSAPLGHTVPRSRPQDLRPLCTRHA